MVLCAIALSLAYPVREYIAQSRRIGQLEAQRQAITAQVNALRSEQQRLSSPAYVEQQARDNLHMCLPSQTCYVIIGGGQRPGRAAAALCRAGLVRAAVDFGSAGRPDRGPVIRGGRA